MDISTFISKFLARERGDKKNVYIDRQFINFSKNVYQLNYKKVIKKLMKSPINFLKLQRDINGILIILFFF